MSHSRDCTWVTVRVFNVLIDLTKTEKKVLNKALTSITKEILIGVNKEDKEMQKRMREHILECTDL